ncbi:hypothetical protein ABPG72_012686 [Tetrahymena utriculariae]
MKKVVKKIDQPIIFTYNVMLNVYKNFGQKHFEHIENHLSKQTNMKAIVLPIISYPEDSIESRAKQASQKIPELLSKHKAEKAHIISYSTSGVDMRYFISEFQGSQFVSSLSTIASPHKGAKVVTAYERKLIFDQHLQAISRLVGLDIASFQEYRPANIRDFNTFILNNPKVQYFTVGGEKMAAQCADSLKSSNGALFSEFNGTSGAPIDNDGVFCFDEVQWGTHLLNFEADHSDLVGLGRGNFRYEQVFDLLIQNIRYNYGTPIGEQ